MSWPARRERSVPPQRGRSSMVEHQPSKLNVARSSRVARFHANKRLRLADVDKRCLSFSSSQVTSQPKQPLVRKSHLGLLIVADPQPGTCAKTCANAEDNDPPSTATMQAKTRRYRWGNGYIDPDRSERHPGRHDACQGGRIKTAHTECKQRRTPESPGKRHGGLLHE